MPSSFLYTLIKSNTHPKKNAEQTMIIKIPTHSAKRAKLVIIKKVTANIVFILFYYYT